MVVEEITNTFLPIPIINSIISLRKWIMKCTESLLSVPNFVVFSYLDFLDSVCCIIYKHLDEYFEGKASPCYCRRKKSKIENGSNEKFEEISETLHGRQKKLKELLVLLEFVETLLNKKKGVKVAGYKNFQIQENGAVYRLRNMWSDCGCDYCTSWVKNDDPTLHVAVKEAFSQDIRVDLKKIQNATHENVIFIHGILSSSFFWTKTIIPKLSESEKSNDYNMFAVDLLGHGQSPKPRDSLYTLKDHVEWIEKSVISQFGLNSFHLVAHSMGTIIALALAAKHAKSVKSITLLAPPYFPSKDGVEFTVMNCLTPKRLWPPKAFLSSIMTWYEHLSRCVCLIMCRNHSTWETFIKRLTRVGELNFMLLDVSKHTHHSGWHTTHNVLYRGVKQMDKNLETLMKSGKKVHVFMGTKDRSVPPDCANKMKMRFPEVQVYNIPNAGHRSVILRREKDFALDLFNIWKNRC